jgi:ribulose-phosphate 3-epimerase
LTWLRPHPTEPPAVAPSLLAADFSRLASEIEAVEQAGADLLHLDVLDGQFVDNITMGPVVLKGIRKLTRLFLDTHLMVEEPGRYAQAFRDAGADGITVHVEATADLDRTLQQVRDTGAEVGLSLNPDTPLGPWLEYLDRIDLLLVMSVHPGFGGQSFQPEVLSKLKRAAEIRAERGLHFALEIDGGIDARTGLEARRAGADVLVAGSAIFRNPPVGARIDELHRLGVDLST